MDRETRDAVVSKFSNDNLYKIGTFLDGLIQAGRMRDTCLCYEFALYGSQSIPVGVFSRLLQVVRHDHPEAVWDSAYIDDKHGWTEKRESFARLALNWIHNELSRRTA